MQFFRLFFDPSSSHFFPYSERNSFKFHPPFLFLSLIISLIFCYSAWYSFFHPTRSACPIKWDAKAENQSTTKVSTIQEGKRVVETSHLPFLLNHPRSNGFQRSPLGERPPDDPWIIVDHGLPASRVERTAKKVGRNGSCPSLKDNSFCSAFFFHSFRIFPAASVSYSGQIGPSCYRSSRGNSLRSNRYGKLGISCSISLNFATPRVFDQF